MYQGARAHAQHASGAPSSDGSMPMSLTSPEHAAPARVLVMERRPGEPNGLGPMEQAAKLQQQQHEGRGPRRDHSSYRGRGRGGARPAFQQRRPPQEGGAPQEFPKEDAPRPARGPRSYRGRGRGRGGGVPPNVAPPTAGGAPVQAASQGA